MVAELASAPALRPIVLLAISYPDERDMYAEYFAWTGYRVEVAANADDAIRATAQCRPAAVVVEHWLPGDGARVCRELKSDPATRHIPVVLIANPPVRIRHCCEGILFKPLPPDQLHETIERLLRDTDLS